MYLYYSGMLTLKRVILISEMWINKLLPTTTTATFLVGGNRIEGQRRVTKWRESTTRRQALLAPTLLATGKRDDLWHPGYQELHHDLENALASIAVMLPKLNMCHDLSIT